MTLVVDIHALQTVPPSLINRDDTGAPKSAIFGGVPRQRVSSQSWKRAIRQYFENNFGPETVGLRSRELPQIIAEKVVELDPEITIEQAIDGVSKLFKATGAKDGIKLSKPEKEKEGEEAPVKEGPEFPKTAALLFLSPHQILRSAEAVASKLKSEDELKFTKSEANDLLDTQHSIDMALFGRMLADAPAYNVDASVQVAHALSVRESQPEFDYYTAVDDVVEDAEDIGAAMIGTTQMMSSTLYRFATVNVEALATNLGNRELANDAAGKFITAFIESMPTGKQNSFANNTLPELVYVAVRDSRSVSLVNAFEDPIPQEGEGRRKAADALAAEERDIEDAYGLKPIAAYVLGIKGLGDAFEGIAEKVNSQELLDKISGVLVAEEAN